MNEELEKSTDGEMNVEEKPKTSYGNELISLIVVSKSFEILDGKLNALRDTRYYSAEQERILVEELIKLVKDTLPLICNFSIIASSPLRNYRLDSDMAISNLLKRTDELIQKQKMSLKIVQNDNALDILMDNEKWTDEDYVRDTSLKTALLSNIRDIIYIIEENFRYLLTSGLASQSLMELSDMATAIGSSPMFKDLITNTNEKVLKFKSGDGDNFINTKNVIRNMLGLVNGELAISKSMGISEDKVLRRQIYDLMQLAASIHAAKTYSITNSRLDTSKLLELSKAIELEKEDPSLINPELTKEIGDIRYDIRAQTIQEAGCNLIYSLDSLNKSFNNIRENGFISDSIESDNIHVCPAVSMLTFDYSDEKIKDFNLLDLLVDEINIELDTLYHLLVAASLILRKAINDSNSSDIGVPPVDLDLTELFTIRSYDEELSNMLMNRIKELLPEHTKSAELIDAFIKSRVECRITNYEVVSKFTTFFRSAEEVSLSMNHLLVAHRVLSAL